MTVVLITGALTGIGRATALAFAKEGTQIVVSGRHPDAGAKLADELRSLGADAEFIYADVGHDEEMRSLVDRSVKRFGRLDVAVNNAGTEGHPGAITEQTHESYSAVFDANVIGTLLSTKHEMRVMIPQGGGSIVNLSSVAGKFGAPGAAVYVASKHAVEGLTKSAALEGAPNDVRVNAVAPGPVETEMLDRFTGGGQRKSDFLGRVPLERAATPQEIADTILFVACKCAFPHWAVHCRRWWHNCRLAVTCHRNREKQYASSGTLRNPGPWQWDRWQAPRLAVGANDDRILSFTMIGSEAGEVMASQPMLAVSIVAVLTGVAAVVARNRNRGILGLHAIVRFGNVVSLVLLRTR